MLILDLWGTSFHAVVIFVLGKNLLFKSILGRCGRTISWEYKSDSRDAIGKMGHVRIVFNITITLAGGVLNCLLLLSGNNF